MAVSMDSAFDLVIVGAGPAGLSAALNAQRNNLNYILLEKTDHLADTIFCYQKKKHVMAEPTVIPLRGQLWMEPAVREDILDHWAEAAKKIGVRAAFNEAATELRKENGSFQIKTTQRLLSAKKVVLGTGTQGNPRKLGVPGDDLPHVLPRLVDPDMYSDQDIVVVGGGDAGIEIAIALAGRNRVTLVVRTPEFIRVKSSLERQALDLAKRGELKIHFNSSVEKIDADAVTLKLPQTTAQVKARVVIVKIGTLPLRNFLEKCGVAFSSADFAAPPVLSGSYESSVPGLYLIGALTGRADLIKHAINQGYEVIEHILGHAVEPADEELLKKKLDFLPGSVSNRIKALLPRTPLLAGGSEDQIRELLLSSEFHRVQRGGVIFEQHDFSESLYMILDGSVDIFVKTDAGEVKDVGRKGAGAFFGEMSLISGRRRTATIKAASDGLLWEVGRKAMLKFIHMTPTAKAAVDKIFFVNAFQTYLFPKSDPAMLARLAEHAKVLNLEKDRVIIKEGDPGDAFYFLRSGKVQISKMRDGREVILSYRSSGDYFGEMALMNDQPRMATVTAIDRVEVIQLLKEDFLNFLAAYPEFRARIEAEDRQRRLRNIEVNMRPELADLRKFMADEEVVVSENVLLIDESRCVHCDNCVKACEGVHTDGQTRLKRTGQKFANILIANSCRHCENPLCMTDCPPGDAIVRDPSGEVFIRDNCIACGNCASNCPYDNIFMVHPETKVTLFDWIKETVGIGRSTKKESKSIAVKCDLCRDLASGPACVRGCPTGAVLRLTPEEYNNKIESLVMERKESV